MPKTTKKKKKTASKITKKKSNSSTPSHIANEKDSIPVFPSSIQLDEKSPYVEIKLSESVLPRKIRLHVRTIVKEQFKAQFLSKVDAGDATGKTSEGETFSVRHLGNWMFGVKGYKANLKITNIGKLGCRVQYSEKMPQEAKVFLNEVKSYFDNLNGPFEATADSEEDSCSSSDETVPVFPEQLLASFDSPKIEFDLPEHVGNTKICVYLRDLARSKFRDRYFAEIDTKGTVGTKSDGTQIPVDSLGRWLFGVPGYKQNIMIRNKVGIRCRINYHKDIPEAALDLLKAFKAHFQSMKAKRNKKLK